MNLKYLIQRNHWLSVKYTLKSIYPNLEPIIEEYQRIYEELQMLEKEETPIVLQISRHWEEGEPTSIGNAYGYDPRIPNSEPTQYISLCWTSWNEWLGFSIDQDTFEEWTELEIICHSLFEMTLDGLTQEEILSIASQIQSKVEMLKENYFKNKLDK